MIRKSPLFLALCLNLFFLFLYFAFGQVRYGSLDDYFMSSVLTGAYGSQYDVHTYFVNSAYGYFLKPFYWLFPKVGWYFIFELVGTFAAFTTFSFFVIRRLGIKYGTIISSVLLASLTPDFYFQLSFTQCATIYTAAGIVSLLFGFSECKKRFLLLGGLFLLAGSIMRYEGFLLGMPFLCFLLAVHFYEKRRISLIAFIAICVTFVSIWGVREQDRSLYSSGDYKYYAAYQPIRAYFGDGAYYDGEATYDELEERGMSGPDFKNLKAWMFYDTDVYQVDSLKPIRKIAQNNLYVPNLKRVVITFFFSISNALMRCSGWCWVLFCVLLMLSSSKKANVYPWFSFGFVAVCIGYLLLLNRLVYHVESGIWVYAITSAIPFMRKDILTNNELFLKKEKKYLLGLVLLSVVFACIGISNQNGMKKHFSIIETPEITDDWAEFLDYADNHPDDVFLLSYNRYKELGTVKNPAYKAIEPGSWQNIFSWGYWNIHLPGMKYEFETRGVQNPIRDVVHKNVYVLEDEFGPVLELFYLEHYHDSVVVDTVKTFGKMVLHKYHLK